MANGKRRGNPLPPEKEPRPTGRRAARTLSTSREAKTFPAPSTPSGPTTPGPGAAAPSPAPAKAPEVSTSGQPRRKPAATSAAIAQADPAPAPASSPQAAPIDPSELAGLMEMGRRPPLGSYIRSVWQRRSFIWYDAKSRFVTQNANTKLGLFWLILQPLMNIAFFLLLFGLVLKVDRDMDNYLGWLTIGYLMYEYTRNSISAGMSVMNSGKQLIRSFSFPRAVLPLSNWVGLTLNTIPVIVVMLIIIMVIPPFELPNSAWPTALGVWAIQGVMGLGMMLLMARLVHRRPDVSKLVNWMMRFLMYGSGVIFPLERYLAEYPVALSIVELNPIYVILKMYRQILMDGIPPSSNSWVYVGAWALGFLVIGFLAFWRKDEAYGRDD
jgi:teichoic acid transport system permease protein